LSEWAEAVAPKKTIFIICGLRASVQSSLVLVLVYEIPSSRTESGYHS